MHFRFLVTFAAEDIHDSVAARGHVYEFLEEEGFCSQGRWGGGMADWFVIGGRWSGELSRHSWAREFTGQVEQLEQQHGVQVWGTFYGYTLKAGQLAYPCHRSKTSGMLAAVGRSFRGMKPLRYIGVPP